MFIAFNRYFLIKNNNKRNFKSTKYVTENLPNESLYKGGQSIPQNIALWTIFPLGELYNLLKAVNIPRSHERSAQLAQKDLNSSQIRDG